MQKFVKSQDWKSWLLKNEFMQSCGDQSSEWARKRCGSVVRSTATIYILASRGSGVVPLPETVLSHPSLNSRVFTSPPSLERSYSLTPKFLSKDGVSWSLKSPSIINLSQPGKSLSKTKCFHEGFGEKWKMGFPYQGDTLRESKTKGQVPTAQIRVFEDLPGVKDKWKPDLVKATE